MTRTLFIAALAFSTVFANVGCATKKFVRQQVSPINDRLGELDDLTAKNSKDIQDVDSKAQQGIASADEKATAAGTSADQANQKAAKLGTGLNGLQGTVENLDNYKPVANTTIQFGSNKYVLTKADEQSLDEFAQQIGQQKHYIVQVQGFTDNVGSPEYNNQLSRRRADAVIQYLAAKHNVPPYRIYIIGLGENNPVAQNNTSSGRAKNRRVDLQLLTNSLESTTASAAQPATASASASAEQR